jgi:peptidoglycan/LPS O-acetylase OafA/YrhL
MHRVIAWTIEHYGASITPLSRFVVTVAVVAAIGYALAFLTYRLVEQPGQQLGRIVLRRLGYDRRQAVQVQEEAIAAP